VEIVLYCQTEGRGRFACAQAGCQDCLNALLREHEKLVHFVIGRQRLGQAEWAEFYHYIKTSPGFCHVF